MAYGLAIFSVVYFNILFLWTSGELSTFSINVFLGVTNFVLLQGRLFSFLGLPVQSYPVDVTSICLLGANLAIWSFEFGFKKGVQISSLLVLPLPIYIYLFDRSEFGMFSISEFSSNPLLAHLSNAVVLYIDVALLLISTYLIHLDKMKLISPTISTAGRET